MGDRPKAGGLGRWTPLAALTLAALAGAQTISLEEAGARRSADFLPVHHGETRTVTGVVGLPAVHFLPYTLLGIQDDQFGLVVQVLAGDKQLDGYEPGDRLEVTGTISPQAGQVTVIPTEIRMLGRSAAPVPQWVTVDDLSGFRYLGRLVKTEGRVIEVGNTTGGAYLLIGDKARPYKIFLPHSSHDYASFQDYNLGDKVRVTGLALQYCPVPPHNRFFELLVDRPDQAELAGRRWPTAPGIVLGGVAGLVVLMVLWWNRDRRLRQQRETLRRSYQLGEEVLGASSVESICRRISEVLPRIFGISQVALYTHNRAARTLESVPGGAEEGMIELASPPAGPRAGVAACFHYRTLLAIPDTARSPFPVTPSEGTGGPKAILYVPMFAQGEVVGVFEMDQNDRTREFRTDEQALAQHLGNQIGAAIRLLDQRAVQEQLFRTEKVAAVGRLISGVVNELEAPLASITDYAEQALGKAAECAAEREIQAIAAEARKAAAMVTRLVSFAGAEQAEARPVELNGLLRSLMEFRENEWKARCIRVREFISRDRLTGLGSQGQLEEVFLNLFVHAEQALAEQTEKTIVVRSGLLGKRVLIEVTFSGPRTGPDPFAPGQEDTPGLSLCRSVVAGHGGKIRLVQTPAADPRFEVELPCAPRERAAPLEGGVGRPVSRRATALVIDSDEASQRHLMGLLTARGYRVVPVGSADVGLDLAQRLRFNAAFCSVHAPGLNWVELAERLQARLDAFVLVSDGYDAELSADFAGDGRFVLPRPVQEHELDRLLEAMVPAVSGA